MMTWRTRVSSILVLCRNKEGASRHYVPALRAGWSGNLLLAAPGDELPALTTFAGLLLTGGGDIHPRHWDEEEPVHPEAELDEERDAFELPLLRQAWELRLPILGICRGEQLLNVALGGSLIQDIPSHFGCDADRHRHGTPDEPDLRHPVAVDPTSRLAEILGCPTLVTNSRHHQAVGRVAPPLKAVAWHLPTERDGETLIEGVEAREATRWALGVQWHPENLVGLGNDAGEAARALFRAFTKAAH